MPRWIRSLLIALAMLVGLGVGSTLLTACGSHPAVVAAPVAPSAFDDTPGTPVVGPDGRQYCGWMYSAAECAGPPASPWPAAPYAMPTAQPIAGSPNYGWYNALFAYHLTYHLFFDSGMYYDHYLTPNHVTVVNRNTYITTVNNFDSKYAAQESAAESKGTYKDKSGKSVPAKSLPKNAFSGGNQGPTNNGNAPKPSASAPKPTAVAPKPTAAAPKPAPVPAPRPTRR